MHIFISLYFSQRAHRFSHLLCKGRPPWLGIFTKPLEFCSSIPHQSISTSSHSNNHQSRSHLVEGFASIVQWRTFLRWHQEANTSVVYWRMAFWPGRVFLWRAFRKVEPRDSKAMQCFRNKNTKFQDPHAFHPHTTFSMPPQRRLPLETNSINVFEVKAILLAFQLFASQWR